MAVYRKVPAKIMTVDYVGVSTAQSETYIKRAETELSKLEGQVLRGGLEQGTRKFDLGSNVFVECTVCFNLKQAVVIIGANTSSRVSQKKCYCCSPCLVAGLIISTTRPEVDSEEVGDPPIYEVEADYYADIHICQAPDTTSPKSIVLHEERVVGAVGVRKSRVLQSMSYGAEIMYQAVYSDYMNHQIGDTVLVLVQPLYDFIPAPFGVYSPCINERKIANEVFDFPKPTCTTDFINSSGFSCQIAKDKQVWTDDPDEQMFGDPAKFPFRVLPIKIDSCL